MRINLNLAELLKVKRTTVFRITLTVIFIFCFILFYQKCFNTSSGYYMTKPHISVQYLLSFNLLLLGLLGNIPGAILGGYISAIEFKNNTYFYSILQFGRLRTAVNKIFSLLITIILLLVFVVVLSVFEGVLVYPSSLFDVDILQTLSQVIVVALLILFPSMISFLLAAVFQNVYIGALITIFTPIFVGYVPSINDIIDFNFSISMIAKVFGNLKNDNQIMLNMANTNYFTSGLLFYIGGITLVLALYIWFMKKHQFKA